MKRTETYQEIKPLVDLCKSGKLFEVQEWHSLIKVLLEGGADINEPRYHARHAHYAKEVGETRVRTLADNI
jgi:hypothetical protein